MRKIILLISIFFINWSFLFAQYQDGVGLVGGLNIAKITSDHSFDKGKALLGPSVGIFLQIEYSYENSIETGVYYSRQGMIYENQVFDFGKKVSYTVKNKIDYVYAPIFYKQYFGSVYTKVGAYAAMGVNVRSEWEQTIEFSDSVANLQGRYKSFERDFNSLDGGFALEVGVQNQLNKRLDWIVNFSFKNGLMKISDNTTLLKSAAHNRFFTVSLGLVMRKSAIRFNKKTKRRV